jgi:HNH endonuclease
MPARVELIDRIAALVGNDVLRITDATSRWPALATLVVDGTEVPVSLFAGVVGLTGRDRDQVERRFQNPGQDRPIVIDPGRRPLLLGLWETDRYIPVERPLLVSHDPYVREGRTTRQSVFVSLTTLRDALETGWAEGLNARGEMIRCFAPPLLAVSFAADRDHAPPEAVAMQTAIEGSGLITATETEIPAAAERARRAGSTLIRDARFSRRVIEAYAGMCAMCGLGVQLVQGAHIYPVSAPGSHDEPWNGLALCPNHHVAFDRHLVAIDIDTREILFHPTVRGQRAGNPAVQALVDGTFDRLAEPAEAGLRPRDEMLAQRYRHYADYYGWMPRR